MHYYERHALYLKILKLFFKDFDQFQKMREHPELSFHEKELFKARVYLRKGELSSAYLLLSNLTFPFDFLKAQSFDLLSHYHYQLGNTTARLQLCLLARDCYKNEHDHRGWFTKTIDAVITSINEGNQTLALKLIKEIDDDSLSFIQKIELSDAKLWLYRLTKDFSKGQKELDFLFSRGPDLPVEYQHQNEGDARYFYISTSDFEQALEKIQLISSYRRTAQSKIQNEYLKHLVLAIHQEKTIPQASELIRSSESTYLKYEIIRLLQGGELKPASEKWDELALISPHLYAENFEVKQEFMKNELIYKSIKKFLREENKLSLAKLLEIKSARERLLYLLENSVTPLCKQEIIEKVWNVEYSPEHDNRFYKLIQGIRKQGHVTILCRHNAYKLAG